MTADFAELKSAVDDFTATTTTALQDARKDIKALADRQAKIELVLGRPGLVGKPGGDLGRERRALGMFARHGSDAELKSMSVDTDPSGGYVTLPEISNTMTRRLWDLSPIRRLARIQVMTTGDSRQEPLDRDESAASWVAERQQPASDAKTARFELR